MSKKKIFVSLNIKLIIVLTVALIVASAVFAGVKELGDFLVWRYYLDEEDRLERADGYIEDFQKYVTDNKLSVKDSSLISSWNAGNYIDMIIYKDSTLFYAPEWFMDFNGDGEESDVAEDSEDLTGETEEAGETEETHASTESDDGESDSYLESQDTEALVGGEESVATEALESDSREDSDVETESLTETGEFVDKGWFSGDRGFVQYLTQEARETYLSRVDDILEGNQALTPIYFVDGTLFVMVVDYTEEFLAGLVFAIAIVSALLVLVVIMLVNFSNTTMRIKRLADNVKLVEGGDLEHPIKAEGNDEITALANDVNSMRNSVVDNMSKEKKAWETNAELITAMSHDVRTPLTVMLGYLDLMELQNSDPSSEEYIAACKENAMKLKRLSDDMFSYFLVFGKNEIDLAGIPECPADLIGHMIAEHQLLFDENGYCVKFNGEIPKVMVKIDAVLFGRVIDNIFSNISKYADQNEPVLVSSDFDGACLKLCFENKIKADDDHAESNRIGIKTCIRIMEQLGGSFETRAENERFTVLLTIPATEIKE